ncbi:MAG: transporter ATP-binding protein [Verrucomicrobia bacterium]|nr:transporter ATP-binding protein [Verrucomicrobiota bacterium]
MSDQSVISVENLGKVYRIWESPAARLKAALHQGVARIFPKASATHRALQARARQFYRDFFALQDISFSIDRGESVGIIGRNGSGKSTLLQIIAGTLQASEGTVKVKGRVAALLELGSGFNPEFTGRENIFLTGSILGLSREEVERKFDGIAAFADIGAFIDQPIKTYSSGMTVRVAFAVQTAVEPDILIVDEALSVGDEAFQRKCFARIDALKKRGTTLLFVSHSAAQVIELCDRAILLADGRIAGSGLPKEIVNIYHQQIYGRNSTSKAETAFQIAPVGAKANELTWTVTAKRPPVGEDVSFLGAEQKNTSAHIYPEAGASISGPKILNLKGDYVDHLKRGQEYYYTYDVRFSAPLTGVRFGATIKTPTGVEIAGMASHPPNHRMSPPSVGQRCRVRFRFRCALLPGTYFLNAGALAVDGAGEEYFAHRIVDACMFRVLYEPNLPVNALVDVLESVEVGEVQNERGNV